MYTGVPREVCLRETGWAEADKGQPEKPNVRTRWVAKEYKTHARLKLYASTPLLEALKVVLSEIAWASVEERWWRWMTCGERTSTLQHEEGCLSSFRPRTSSQVTNTGGG